MEKELNNNFGGFDTLNIYEIIGACISLICILVSFMSFYKGKRRTKPSVRTERQMNRTIKKAKDRLENLYLDTEKRQLFPWALNEALENYINVFEDACTKYLDMKIDRDRFKKTYKDRNVSGK